MESAESHPLEVTLQRKPDEFLSFFRSSLLLSLALVLARIPVINAAIEYQAICTCTKPLHVWLLIEAMLAFLQVPLRGGLLWFLPKSFDGSKNVEATLRVLNSPGSMVSSRVTQGHFVWNLIGLLWGIQSRCNGECPLQKLTLVVLSITFMRAGATLLYYGHGVAKPDKAKSITYDSAKTQSHHSHTCCAVCLDNFTENQELRQFKCGHAFCVCCADRWLEVKRSCPVCQRSV